MTLHCYDYTYLYSYPSGLQVMCHPERGNKKHPLKKKSVRICLEKEEDVEKSGFKEGGAEEMAQATSEAVKEPMFGPLKSQHLEDLICRLVQLCLQSVNNHQSERHLVVLSLLLRSFHTPRVFKVMISGLKSAAPGTNM